MNNIFKVVTEKGFTGGAHTKTLLELLLAAVGYPSNLGGKALNVIFFLLQETLGNEHRHIHVLVTELLEHSVHNALDIFPDGITVGTDYHTPLNRGIIDKLRFDTNIGVPFCEILIHRGNRFN